MPCYTIRTIGVDLTVADAEVLLRGLERAGIAVTVDAEGAIHGTTRDGERFTITAGQVVMRGAYVTEEQVAAMAGRIKDAYGVEAVKTAAKRFAFDVQFDKQDAKHFVLARKGGF